MAKTGLGTSVWHIFEKRPMKTMFQWELMNIFIYGIIEYFNVIMAQNN